MSRHRTLTNEVDMYVNIPVYFIVQRNLKRLSSFHHKAIKRILGLNWERVKEEKITKEEVRRRFNNIPNIETYIIRRRSRYIGKVIKALCLEHIYCF